MNKLLSLLTLVLVLISTSHAQEFTITRVELQGGNVNLYYDLLDSAKGRTYTIELYSSKDNFISRLEKTSGDIGLEIKPGGNHKIIWNATEEFGATFEGKVGLEVRGRVYIPFIRLEGLSKIYKRKKDYQLNWRGGTQQNILKIDLYKGDEVKYSIPNVANVGQTTINLPKSVKPGKNYYFKISDSKNRDQIVITPPFRIKRKIPLLLQIIPVAAIVAVVSNLGDGSGDSKSIPDPLSPGTIH